MENILCDESFLYIKSIFNKITHHDRGSVWLASEIEVDAAAWLSILEDTCLKIAILPPASKVGRIIIEQSK